MQINYIIVLACFVHFILNCSNILNLSFIKKHVSFGALGFGFMFLVSLIRPFLSSLRFRLQA